MHRRSVLLLLLHGVVGPALWGLLPWSPGRSGANVEGAPTAARRTGERLVQTDRSEAQRAQIRADYRHGRTVCVDGWILSRTEAERCPGTAPNSDYCPPKGSRPAPSPDSARTATRHAH